jgi:Zn-dependent peptidase ImmA (M78 family)/transcriptional regulator with XRE-family HTH domain
MERSARFVGARLELARTFRGFTLKDLAKLVSASTGLLSHYETGRKKQPSPDLVGACSEVLGVQPDFFYQPLEDVWREEECSFRRRRATPESAKKRARAHGTFIGLLIRELAALARFPALDIPALALGPGLDIEGAAQECRVRWSLGTDTPILHMGRVVELAGVPIVQNLLHTDKIDAFSRRGAATVIVLNPARGSTSRWIFDIAHELGHLVLHRYVETGSRETEGEANCFASAFLLPRRTFSREFAASRFSWGHIFALKRRWRISAAAIVRRAYDLGLLDATEYRRAYAYMSARRWLKGEPEEPPFAGPELIRNALRALGDKVAELSSRLHVTPQTFWQLTGLQAPLPAPQRARLVLLGRPQA